MSEESVIYNERLPLLIGEVQDLGQYHTLSARVDVLGVLVRIEPPGEARFSFAQVQQVQELLIFAQGFHLLAKEECAREQV